MTPLYKSDIVGDLAVRTFDVAIKKVYLTLVFENDRPFDLNVADTYEDAIKNHEEFMATARIMAEAMPTLKKIAATGEKVTRQDIDSVIQAFLPPPDGTLLN